MYTQVILLVLIDQYVCITCVESNRAATTESQTSSEKLLALDSDVHLDTTSEFSTVTAKAELDVSGPGSEASNNRIYSINNSDTNIRDNNKQLTYETTAYDEPSNFKSSKNVTTYPYNFSVASRFSNTVDLKYRLFKHHDESYVFVEPVDCCDYNDIEEDDEPEDVELCKPSTTLKNPDDAFSEYESIDIERALMDLGSEEEKLYYLHNLMINQSKETACTLKLSAGRRALNTSREYTEKRQQFLIRTESVIKLLQKHNMTAEDTFFKIEFFEKELYQKNLNFTRNVTDLLETLCTMLQEFEESNYKTLEANEHIKQYDAVSDTTVLADLVAELINLTKTQGYSLLRAEYFLDMLNTNTNLKNLFYTQNILKFMDLKSRESKLNYLTNRTDSYIYLLEELKAVSKLYEKVEITTLGIICVIGIFANGTFIFIFVRYKEIRTSNYLILLNLAISDMLSLFINIPVFYSANGHIDDTVCKIYQLIRTLFVGVSVYCVVVVSFQRFVALSLVSKKTAQTSIWPLLSVWVIGFIIAIPRAFISGTKKDGLCYTVKHNDPVYQLTITLFDVLGLCIIPVFFMTIFTGFTVDEAKCRYKIISHDTVKEEQHEKNVAVSSNILIGLIVVFGLTYAPFYLFRFVYVWSGMKIDTLLYVFVFVGVYCLSIINSCVNPFILCIVSEKCRHCIKTAFVCHRRDALKDDSNLRVQGGSVTTIESTF
ncbi:uncharacterized protein [Periplaneta americana]|uniref:uncharacterized protein n=1 Tax=Periplaneta americana TaxID=6978 RepID=UPI0037E72370